MFPFVLIAAAAAAFLAFQSQEKKDAKKPGSPALGPSGQLTTCDLTNVPEPTRSQIAQALAIATSPTLPPFQIGPAATVLDTLATPAEIAGYKDVADCLRANALALRARAPEPLVKAQPGVMGLAPIVVEPITITVEPKGRE